MVADRTARRARRNARDPLQALRVLRRMPKPGGVASHAPSGPVEMRGRRAGSIGDDDMSDPPGQSPVWRDEY